MRVPCGDTLTRRAAPDDLSRKGARWAVRALLSTLLLLAPMRGGFAAAPAPLPAAEKVVTTPELLSQIAGAVTGFGIYSLFVAPQATATEGIVGVLGGRIVAATLAGAGAVAGTFIYDVTSGEPLDYAYFWHRGGFIVGIAAGIAAFGVLGYPLDGGATWLGWAANRATLLGTGLVGAWLTDRWYEARVPVAAQ